MNSPIKTILTRLKKEKLDGLIVFSPSNISYLSGFISRDAYLLVSGRKNLYFTDGRYLQEAKKYLSHKLIIKNIGGSFLRTLSDSIAKLRLKRIGFEAGHIAYGRYRMLRKALGKKVGLVAVDGFVEELRQKKSREELVKIRRAAQIAALALKYARRIVRPGAKEIEVAAELERFIRYHGADTSAFEMIVASGVNSSFPHHRTGQRKIRNNEPVLIDLGVDYQGYKSDLTRVFFLGRINFSVRRIYDIVVHAQSRALGVIKPGVAIEQVDASARRYISEKGFGKYFTHSLGHGVGLEVHEAPTISFREKTKLEPGMVFTLEPAIYLPNKFGVRIEDMVLVTKEGRELISGILDK